MKKMITVLAITGSLAVTGVVAAAGIQNNSGKILSSEEVSKKALSYVKGTVYKVELDKEKGIQVYEIDVQGENNKEYELKLDAKTGELLKKSMEISKVSNTNTSKKVIGLAKAKEIALGSVKGSVNKAKLDQEDGIYEIEIVKAGYEYDFDINAYTGKIVKKEQEKFSKKVVTGKVIGLEKAKQIALSNVGGTVQKAKLDKSDGVYEIEIIKGTTEYDFEIDAKTGKILVKESEEVDALSTTINKPKPSNATTTNMVIGDKKASQIALTKAKGTITKIELDEEDGVYEIEVKDGVYEYDLEIDATTGVILDFEKEYEDD
ncbi:PepSY domain-containing protein [Viridibacillus sp. YIM B01967]|uniref:PepSY domain-containing protein n=1 Tax=Viridibacillus soli TaxID=2798301 RepID=A0ABS1H874_9BACL|nr:PepSY domain-containing protein [Viridibacillus soli]MBK3495516.1 PepSY domain-containing protein [Viridibacillus soli]